MEDYLSESICRTCLQSSDELTSLHLKDGDTGLTLLDKLRFCASMQVPMSKHTPSNACAPCVRCITNYYDFKRRCEQSEKTLEELSVKYTVPNDEVFLKEEEDDGDVSKVAAKMEPDDSNSMCVDGSDWTNISEEVDGAMIARDDEGRSEGKPQFACETCGKCFTRNDALKRHRCVHELQFISVSGESSNNLDNHLERQSCNVCGLELKSVEEQSTHVQNCLAKETDKMLTPVQLDDLKEKDNNPCDMCTRSFPTNKHLKRHKLLSHSARRHRCDQCGASFSHAYRLRLHMESHKKGSKYVCDTCGKAYRSAKCLRIHTTETHAAEKPVYLCRVCGKTYNFISSLNAHRRTHKLPSFKCDICKKSFKTKHDLRKHICRHMRKRQCDGCNEVFDSLPKMRKHRTIAHPDLHPYVVEVPENRPSCDLCKKTFRDRCGLRRHLRLHTVEQPKSQIDPTAEVLKESSNSDVAQHDSEDKKRSPGQLDSLNNPCDMCSRTFPTMKHLKRHKTLSHSVRRHRCNQCGASYPQAYHLRRHMETHKEGSKYVCDTCGKAFRGAKSLRLHMTESHGAKKPIYECNVCGKTYNFISSLNAHKRTHNREKLTPKALDVGTKKQCDGSDEVFNSLPEMLEHKTSAHPDLDPHIVKVPPNRPSCDFCKKTFSNRSSLRRHLRLHALQQLTSPIDSKTDASNRMESANSDSAQLDNEVKFLTPGKVDDLKEKYGHSCDQCPRSFAIIEYLREHKMTCHSERRHQCDQCGSSFAQARHLRRHMERHAPGVKNKFICETCGKEYSFEESLRLHIEEKHSAEKPIYTCKVCGKTYNCMASINSHKRTHVAVKDSFRCDRCDGAYPSRTRLKQHIKLTHDKPYSCDMCDKRFGIKVDLLKHKAYHAIEMAKPYTCTLCEKRFSTASAVTFHVNTLHHGKKHLKCDVCGMEFYNRFHHAAHYSSHTGIKPYRCDGCGLGYNYNSDLKKHEKNCASLLELARQ